MKGSYLLMFFCFTTSKLCAQALKWQWAVQGGGTSWDEGRSICADASGRSMSSGIYFTRVIDNQGDSHTSRI